MDIEQEINNHIEWIEQIATLLGDEPISDETLETVKRHDRCKLGQWLDSEQTQNYRDFPDFPALIESHNAFHALAGELIAAYQKGSESEALESETRFIEMSRKVIGHLQALKASDGNPTAQQGR